MKSFDLAHRKLYNSCLLFTLIHTYEVPVCTTGFHIALIMVCLLLVPAPDIITHPTDTSAAAPFSAVFTCSAKGYGFLNITWFKNNKVYNSITNKATMHQTSSINITTSTLVIYNVTEDDMGVYYCLVWANSKASQSRIANLLFSGTAY